MRAARPWPIYLLLVVLAVGAVLWMMRPAAPTTTRGPDDWVAQYGGERSMYVGILSSRDCDALQARVLMSIRSGDRGYERAASERMTAVDC